MKQEFSLKAMNNNAIVYNNTEWRQIWEDLLENYINVNTNLTFTPWFQNAEANDLMNINYNQNVYRINQRRLFRSFIIDFENVVYGVMTSLPTEEEMDMVGTCSVQRVLWILYRS